MKETQAKPMRFIRNDIILIVSLLLVAALGMLYLFKFRSAGDTVRVTVDGKLYKTYSLSQDITEDIITGENGEYLNRLVIKDGKAYIERATCPDGICVDHSPIFRDGESIVCLPQRVVVTVITNNSADSPDVIV
jgi:hypothetical protein